MDVRRGASSDRAMAASFVVRKAKALDLVLGKAARRVTSEADDEAVHDMRVAIRRLRTLLRLSRPLYGRFRSDAVRSAFSEVAARAGELRDEEALEATFEDLGVDDPLFVAWRLRRRLREKRLRSSLITGLKKGELARPRKLL